jgi:hypothetical protein
MYKFTAYWACRVLISLNPRIDTTFVKDVFADGKCAYEFVDKIIRLTDRTQFPCVMFEMDDATRASESPYVVRRGWRRCNSRSMFKSGEIFFKHRIDCVFDSRGDLGDKVCVIHDSSGFWIHKYTFECKHTIVLCTYVVVSKFKLYIETVHFFIVLFEKSSEIILESKRKKIVRLT